MEKIPIDALEKVTGGDAPASNDYNFKPGESWLRLWKNFQVKPLQSPR